MSAAAVVRRMRAFKKLLRSADGVRVLDYEDPNKPLAADLRLENDTLFLRRETRTRFWRPRRNRQPVERQIPLKQVAFACPSHMVEDKDCFWIVGASHTLGERIIDCETWRLKLLLPTNPPPMQNVLDFLQSQGKFDNIVLTNVVPTEVANLMSEAVSAVNDIASVVKDIVGLQVVTSVVKLTFMCVATVETVQGLKSDFIAFLEHWERVRNNLEKSQLLGRAIIKLAEDFFFKSALGKMGASKDFVANLARLNDRAGMAIDARLLELASDQNKALEELQAGVDEILRILCLARDAMPSLRSLGILAAVVIAIVFKLGVPLVPRQQLTGVTKSIEVLDAKMDSIVNQVASTSVVDNSFDWMNVKSMLPQSRLFMGREDELRAIREHVDEAGTITSLVGVAGCGKSHLARKAAYQWSKDAKENEHRIVLFASVANEESYVSYLPNITKTIG